MIRATYEFETVEELMEHAHLVMKSQDLKSDLHELHNAVRSIRKHGSGSQDEIDRVYEVVSDFLSSWSVEGLE